MKYFNIVCISLVLFVLTLEIKSKPQRVAIDTFESTDNKLILLRMSRHVQPNIIMLRQRLRKLIIRRRYHYNRLKTAKNKMAAMRIRNKLKKVQKDIKKLRKQLINHRKNKQSTQMGPIFKSANIQEVQAAFTIKNRQELRELHEKCKNQGCSQLCTPEVDNITGMSQCHCHRGFRLDSKDNRTCLDVNECKLPTTRCQHKCVNTIGSYYCSCPLGEKLSYDKSTCIDINECFLNNNHGPCQDGCINLQGSYSCTCDRFTGTRLSENGHGCEDIDECRKNISGCSHDCFNVYNSFVCGCPDGMLLDDDYKTCVDMNECLKSNKSNITCSGKCINTIGSYFCLDVESLNRSYSTCNQMTPTKDGYYLCDRNNTAKVILKGITDREHFLNTPGTVCTYYTHFHVAVASHVCNDHATWEAFPLTFIKNNNF